MKILSTLLSLLLLLTTHTFAAGWGYDNNRIAISADGNNQPDNHHFWPRADPDDWGATPATLAIIAKLKMHKNLVHYSYNNFIDAPEHTTAINEMAIGVQGAINYWNFDNKKFFDVSADYKKALAHLIQVIEVSTHKDPLYFVHMGPSEFFYRAVKAVIANGKIDSLSHVYVLSHSGYNDNHLRRGDPKFDKKPVPEQQKHHTLTDVIELSGKRINYHRIKDQNAEWDVNLLWNSKQDWSVWQWMKNHSDPSVAWIYERMKRHPDNKADISDAGMLYFLLLGDENASPQKFKKFIGQGIMP
ncbi:hypothetical protein [Catenovulum sediminis]|uniref:hypothetical protein n=1 Tax=Catenovulum sediminis TaxID=1740262 RepID=UPI00163DA387|nr:hypothetical protein [Catenovulum sediminis]